MRLAAAIGTLLLGAAPQSEPAWKVVAVKDGVTVSTRQHAASGVREVKAVGLMNAPPQAAYDAVLDYPAYPGTMPYTEECMVLAEDEPRRERFIYFVVNPPIIARRDYVARVVDESDWRDGAGYLKISWTPTEDHAPPLLHNRIRLVVNEGYWLLEPREGGKQTLATYYIYIDPGGSLPGWLANFANTSTVPRVFEALRLAAARHLPKPIETAAAR